MEGNFSIKHQKCNGNEKRDRILFSKMEFSFQIS